MDIKELNESDDYKSFYQKLKNDKNTAAFKVQTFTSTEIEEYKKLIERYKKFVKYVEIGLIVLEENKRENKVEEKKDFSNFTDLDLLHELIKRQRN